LKIEEKVKKSAEFKKLDVDNFRKKAAKELRDRYLTNSHVNFLVQAFRYRGKANYRDSIFLSYGYDNNDKVKQFTQDLLDVTKAFIRMTTYYVSKRIGPETWEQFINDLEEHSRLSISLDDIKI